MSIFSEILDEISVFQNYVLSSGNFRKFRRFSEDFRDPMGPKCGRISVTGPKYVLNILILVIPLQILKKH